MGEEALDDVESSIGLDVLVEDDEVSAPAEGVGHEGDVAWVGGPDDPGVPDGGLVLLGEVDCSLEES